MGEKRTAEEVRAEAAELAKRRRLPEFTKILLDWDDNVAELTLTTGEKVTGALHVNFDFTVVFIADQNGDEWAYRIDSVIGARYIGEDFPS